MCRWFAYLSATEPCLLEDVLVNPPNALSKQVHDHYLPQLIAHNPQDLHDADHLLTARNSLYNIDGLGVSWYTTSFADFELGKTGQSADGAQQEGLFPAVYKTVQSPLNDLNFRSLAANTETRCLMAHIRAASGTPIVAVNNHPFVFGRHSFMHNGVVAGFHRIKRAVCAEMSQEAFEMVQGGTDSEHLAALYMTYLTTSSTSPHPFNTLYTTTQMSTALQKTISTIIIAQQNLLGSSRLPNSLNLCATDGTKLVACRFRNHATQQPPSLYYSEKAGTTLNRKFEDSASGLKAGGDRSAGSHGEHLIVASEPSTYRAEDWVLIPKNDILIAEAGGSLEVRKMDYGEGWDAEDAGS